ncbi:MAG: type II secretion system F family protein [Symbiobacteriia bacterium]
MSFGWVGPAAAAVGGLVSAWLLTQHLGGSRRREWRRLQRLQFAATEAGEKRPGWAADPGRSGGRPAAPLPWNVVQSLRRGYQARRLEEQLEQALVTMTNSLRAGLSLLQALEVAAGEAMPPLREDLTAVLDEYRVGRPLEQALADWSGRRRSEDLVFFARAIAIHRESGGDLGLVLSSLAQTVRDRRLLRLELAAKTSESRLTAAVLILMVPLLALFLGVFQRQMLAPLWERPLGRIGLAYALTSWAAGALVAGRLVRVPFAGGGG